MAPLILTVEDEAAVSNLIRLHLENAGYEVMSAATVDEALNLLGQRRPDVIVTDLMLPDIDGFGLFEILRRDREMAEIPVIMLTGWDSSEAREVGLELGAAAYLHKPFKPRELIEQIRAVVRTSGAKTGSTEAYRRSVSPAVEG